MAQYDFGTIDSAIKTGAQLAGDLNSWRDAVHTCHKGSSQPSYRQAGIFWLDDAATPWLLKINDGVDWITIGTVNATTDFFVPYRNGAALPAPLGAGPGLATDGTNLSVSSPTTSSSGTYSMVATDNGGLRRFTAAATYNLLAASTAGNGFRSIVHNASASADVTLDPSGSETLDGLTTRLLRPGDRVEVACDGSAWITLTGCYGYDSGDQTNPAAAGSLTLAHGLGMTPTELEVLWHCTTAEGNYAVGDYVYICRNQQSTTGSDARGLGIVIDATNVAIRCGSATPYVFLLNKTTGAILTPTLGNWSLVVRARVRY